MRDQDRIEPIEIDYHRNGVGGAGFYAFRFNWWINGGSEPTTFIGMHFPDGDVTTGVVIEDAGTIEFGINSWRGDHVHDHVRFWIATLERVRNDYETEHGMLAWYDTSFAYRMELLRDEVAKKVSA